MCVKSAAVKVWPSITKEKTQSMARSMISRLRQSLSAKDSIYAKQNIKYEHFIYDYIYLSNHIWALEKEGCVKKLLSILCYIVQPPELKLKVCTSITSWLFYFKSIVVVYRGKITKAQSVSEYTTRIPEMLGRFLHLNKMKTKRLSNHMSKYFFHNRT